MFDGRAGLGFSCPTFAVDIAAYLSPQRNLARIQEIKRIHGAGERELYAPSPGEDCGAQLRFSAVRLHFFLINYARRFIA